MKTRLTGLLLLFFGYLFKEVWAQDFAIRNHYLGYIGSNNKVYMDLHIKGKDISGYYFYYRTGIPIDLEGSINPDKSYKINERVDGKWTGIFIGKLTDFNKLTGEWSTPEGRKKFRYELKLIARSEEVKSDSYNVAVAYPQFSPGEEDLLPELNDTLKTLAHNLYDGFIQDNEFSTPEMPPSFLNIGYTIEYFADEIISLLFTHYEYTGGAHPNTYYSALNFCLSGDKITFLELGDLFLENSNYLKVLSDICIDRLKNQNASFVIDGMVNDVSDMLDVFNLTPTKLAFTFAPYQVGPYVEGSHRVEISYAELKSIINPVGPLARLLKFTRPGQ